MRNVAFALIGSARGRRDRLLHVVPLRGFAVKVEQALSAWLNDDVSIASTTFRLDSHAAPARARASAVGKSLDAKAATGRIYVDLVSLFGDKLVDQLDRARRRHDLRRGGDAHPGVGQARRQGRGGGITSIRLNGVKLDVKPAIEPFNANARASTRDGRVQRRRRLTAGAGWTLALKPGGEGHGPRLQRAQLDAADAARRSRSATCA